eukprot:evm.model.scf_27.14 EVM.evm.TU.scf_27.14   scf_27:99754-108258(-)
MQDFMGFLHLGWDLATSDGCNHNALQLSQEDAASTPSLAAVQQILGWSVLHLAAVEGRVPHIENLVMKFNCDVHCQSANSWTPLHYAAAYNQVASIEALVRLGAKVDVRDSVGSTPLHVACGEGHMEAVLKLIELGCDPAVKDRDGCTPLYCAAAWNRIDVVRELHRLGCPSWAQSEEGRTAVHVAAEQGWVDLLEVLVKELDSIVDSRDTYQFTPLHSAANWGWVGAIQKLVELKHSVDVRDYLGRTPLHYAALHGRAAAIEELVQLGASLHEKDTRGGYTPLHLAADAGQCEAVAKLVELGADTEAKTAKGWTCLQLATMKGPANVDVLGLLVELKADVKAVTENKNLETPLHIAARAGRLDIVQKLINCGVGVCARTKDGSTPLHYAAAFGQSQVLETLVKGGCDIHSRDNAQNSPLHLAAGCGFLDAVVKLVELGGDLNCRDMSDCTPLQNTAHGTYSALAAVPPGMADGTTAKGLNSQLGSLSLRKSGLSSAVLPQGSGSSAAANGGMVPVRTGFAWATLGTSDALSSMYFGDLDETTPGRPSHNWKGAELMSLLRKATRSRRAGSMLFGSDLLHDQKWSSDERDNDDEWDRWSHRDLEREREGLELLLKKTEALQLSQMEQDRSRLIPVAEKMVDLGAYIAAKDNEGRTALHLAAGCGDRAMVIKLVDLGADINCKDSVGGTPMHHAAMANKKDMMFTLARLGCDWRAKAEGIDGATAAYVLCGQHGKTTRQQKLLEAKLKRVYLEGELARKAGKNPMDVAPKEEPEEDLELISAIADANMAALLEEEAAEAAKKEKKREKKRKHKSKVAKSADKGGSEAVDGNGVLKKGAGSCGGKGGKSANGMLEGGRGGGRELAENGTYTDSYDPDDCEDGDESQAAIRGLLEEAVTCAQTVLEIGAATPEDTLHDVLQKLDAAIQQATQGDVSAKYAKKVRKRLQGLADKETSQQEAETEPSDCGGPSPAPEASDNVKDVDEDDSGWASAHHGLKGRHAGGRLAKHDSGRGSTDQASSSSKAETDWQHVGNGHGKKTGSGPGSTSGSSGRSVKVVSQSIGRQVGQAKRSGGGGKITTIKVITRTSSGRSATLLVQQKSPRIPSQPTPPSAPSVASVSKVWSQGSRHKGYVMSDPEFPPLQATAQAAKGAQSLGTADTDRGHKSSARKPLLESQGAQPKQQDARRGAPKQLPKPPPEVAPSQQSSAAGKGPNNGKATPTVSTFMGPAAPTSPVGNGQLPPERSAPSEAAEGPVKQYELFGDQSRLTGPPALSPSLSSTLNGQPVVNRWLQNESQAFSSPPHLQDAGALHSNSGVAYRAPESASPSPTESRFSGQLPATLDSPMHPDGEESARAGFGLPVSAAMWQMGPAGGPVTPARGNMRGTAISATPHEHLAGPKGVPMSPQSISDLRSSRGHHQNGFSEFRTPSHDPAMMQGRYQARMMPQPFASHAPANMQPGPMGPSCGGHMNGHVMSMGPFACSSAQLPQHPSFGPVGPGMMAGVPQQRPSSGVLGSEDSDVQRRLSRHLLGELEAELGM